MAAMPIYSDDLDILYGKVNIGRLCIGMGRKWAMWLNINDSEKMDTGLICPQPGAINMIVYYHNI